MEVVINRLKLIQILSTSVSGVLTILLPIINYIQFKNSLAEDVNLGGFETTYDGLIIWVVIVGIMITVSTYFIFEFPNNSIKRGSVSLMNSVLDVVFIYIFSYMSLINMTYTCQNNCRKEITLNLTGVYMLLIIIMSLYVVKNAYDLIDYNINQKYYRRNNTKKITKKPKLVKCSKCNYMCRIEWKKCPICNYSLKKTVKI